MKYSVQTHASPDNRKFVLGDDSGESGILGKINFSLID